MFSNKHLNNDLKIPLNWEVGSISEINQTPMVWYPATVPGAVQLDFAEGLNYGKYYFAENWKDYSWMENNFFIYRTFFQKPELSENQQCFFISKGIDYEFEIWFNGQRLFYQEGMFTYVNIDLTHKLQYNNELRVIIYPIPKLYNQPVDRGQASQSVKPPQSYGWDWHPRIVPVGIWDETYLSILNKSKISDISSNYSIENELKSVYLTNKIIGENLSGYRYLWSISDATGKEIMQSKGNFTENEIIFSLTLENVQLWWPHDQGVPYLYEQKYQLLDTMGQLIQEEKYKIGFRKVSLVMNEGAWDEPSTFPKSQCVAPLQMEINGRIIFCKGSNWISPEIFYGKITNKRYSELIDRATDANFNIFRVWGGGIINKNSFYELCDEKGMLVWQEFPLSCNNYEGTPKYLKILEQESTSIIKRLKKFASVVLWCGGNELYNNWSRMTNQSLAIRLLNSQCLKYDPQTPFLDTSPIIGMAHGNYVFRDFKTGQEVFESMANAKNTAYTEFGIPAPATIEILETIIPKNELWPPKNGTSWESHHGFNAWIGNTWLMPDIITEYFGEQKSLEEMVANGQLLQSEGYKFIFEEARRQKPYCSMSLNWCFNEPWPTAANNSLISWPNSPKPAYFAVKNSCRPFLASARIKKFKYVENEEFTADIWILNDLPVQTQQGKMMIKLVSENKTIHLGDWKFDKLQPNTNLSGMTVRCILPDLESNRFRLVLEVENHPEFDSEYTLLFEKKKIAKKKQILNN